VVISTNIGGVLGISTANPAAPSVGLHRRTMPSSTVPTTFPITKIFGTSVFALPAARRRTIMRRSILGMTPTPTASLNRRRRDPRGMNL
jgi:hypothetical protein